MTTMSMEDPWEVAAGVDRASKAGDHAAAFQLADQGLARHPDSNRLRGAKAWALYRRDIGSLGEAPDLQHRRRAKQALDEISELVGEERYGSFSPVIRATLRFSKALLERYPEAALDILRSLDGSKLDRVSSEDYSSDRGQWYLKVTSALKDLERWDELITTSSEVLETSSLRAEDEVWIHHRLGQGLLRQGRPAEALEHLRAARARKPEWWLDLLIAEALLELARADEATTTLAKIAERNLRSPFAYRAFTLLGEALETKDAEAARSCVQQARYLRTKAGWPTDQQTEALAQRLGIEAAAEVEPDRTALRADLEDLTRAERSKGTIEKVLANGGSGFLTMDHGASLYFSMAPGKSAPPAGTQVSFEVVDGYDKKKDRPSKKAVDVRPA